MELFDYLRSAADSACAAYIRVREAAADAAQSVGAGRLAELGSSATDIMYTITALLRDGRVPRRAKVKLALAAAYFALPIDGLPGCLDDIYVALAALASVMDDIGADEMCAYWPGDEADLMRFIALMRKFNDRCGTGAVLRLAAKLGISASIEVAK